LKTTSCGTVPRGEYEWLVSRSKQQYSMPRIRHLLRAGLKLAGRNVPQGVGLARWCVGWYRAKNPVLRFVVVFVLLLGLFYGIVLSGAFQARALPPYLRLSAQMASAVCNGFGQHTRAVAQTISSNRFSINISFGCDASESAVLFAAAVLAFPAPLRRKIPGIVLGVVILAAVNLVRIASLFLVGVYFPNALDWMHREVWPAVFIMLAIGLWAFWIRWAMKPRTAVSYVPG